MTAAGTVSRAAGATARDANEARPRRVNRPPVRRAFDAAGSESNQRREMLS